MRATPGQFYPPYLIAMGRRHRDRVRALIHSGYARGAARRKSGEPPPEWFFYAYLVPLYGSYFVVWAFLAAALANLVYNHTDLGAHRFRSTLKGHELLWIYAGNTVAILASAGFLIPWAKVPARALSR